MLAFAALSRARVTYKADATADFRMNPGRILRVETFRYREERHQHFDTRYDVISPSDLIDAIG